jgi:hypothetical protein
MDLGYGCEPYLTFSVVNITYGIKSPEIPLPAANMVFEKLGLTDEHARYEVIVREIAFAATSRRFEFDSSRSYETNDRANGFDAGRTGGCGICFSQ